MSDRSHEVAEIDALLNARDELRSRRRRPRHLSPECYDTLEPAYCVTLCARHHREPFR
jgi:hypothetical protein